MRDSLYQNRYHMDIFPKAGSSDATSDGSVPDGIGVQFTGYRYATVLGMVGTPSGTSDNVATVALQYGTGTATQTTWDIASDFLDTDYSAFSTDAVSAQLTFATSDQLNNGAEGFAIVHVDLAAHGLTKGVVRVQILQNGTAVSNTAAIIVLSGYTGAGGSQGGAVAVTPRIYP